MKQVLENLYSSPYPPHSLYVFCCFLQMVKGGEGIQRMLEKTTAMSNMPLSNMPRFAEDFLCHGHGKGARVAVEGSEMGCSRECHGLWGDGIMMLYEQIVDFIRRRNE